MNINLLDLMNTSRNLSHQNMKYSCYFSPLTSQFTGKMIANERVKKKKIIKIDSHVCSLRMVKAISIIKRLFLLDYQSNHFFLTKAQLK